jgi:hypothetical protein
MNHPVTGITHYHWSDVLGNPIEGWYVSTTMGIYWCTSILQGSYSWHKYFDGVIYDITSKYNRLLAISEHNIYTSSGASDWYECTPTNVTSDQTRFNAVECDGTSFYVFGDCLLKAT